MNVALAVVAVFSCVLGVFGVWGLWRAFKAGLAADDARQQCELAEQRALHWFEAHRDNSKALGELLTQRAEEKRKARESAVRGWETRRKGPELREAA